MEVLRDYQLDVTDRTRQKIREGARRTLIQAPQGAGKTHISSEIVRCSYEKGKSALFLAHRRRLILQKSERLARFNVPHGIIMADTMARPGRVQVASRDTLLSRSIRHEWDGFPPADIVILDEAHHLNPIEGDAENPGDVYQQILRAYPRAVILGLTATPARPDGTSLGRFWQALECTVPTSQLIAEGHLVPIRCYAPLHMGKARKGKRANKLSGDPVANWLRWGAGRPTVLFGARREETEAVCRSFQAAGITAEYFDARTPDEEREAIVGRIRSGQTQIICNVGLVTEGVDIPELSCCIMLRSCGSYVLFAQCVGRIMRPSPGKKDGILIDHAGAVFEHGFPDEDVEWSLDEGSTVDERARQAKKEGRRKNPVCCPNCAAVFSGSAECPDCGWHLPKKLRKQTVTAEILAEIERKANPDTSREERVKYWNHCLLIMAAKGKTTGSAGQMYRARYHRWPERDLPNVPVGNDWRRPVADVYPQYTNRRVPT